MAEQLTDLTRKKIVADSVGGMSQRALAKKYNVSTTAIRRAINRDPEFTQKIAHKKEENTIAVLAHMDSKKGDVCALIDKLLAAINNSDKIAATSLSQIATTMGILIDKYTANESRLTDGKNASLADTIIVAYNKRKNEEQKC